MILLHTISSFYLLLVAPSGPHHLLPWRLLTASKSFLISEISSHNQLILHTVAKVMFPNINLIIWQPILKSLNFPLLLSEKVQTLQHSCQHLSTTKDACLFYTHIEPLTVSIYTAHSPSIELSKTPSQENQLVHQNYLSSPSASPLPHLPHYTVFLIPVPAVSS